MEGEATGQCKRETEQQKHGVAGGSVGAGSLSLSLSFCRSDGLPRSCRTRRPPPPLPRSWLDSLFRRFPFSLSQAQSPRPTADRENPARPLVSRR